jgi:hypothetical protein
MGASRSLGTFSRHLKSGDYDPLRADPEVAVFSTSPSSSELAAVHDQ